MELTTAAVATVINTVGIVKSPEAESETPPPRIQHTKALPLSNGVLKRHNSHHNHHTAAGAHPVSVVYKECLKNHAATLGGHALDGCGEFMPSPTAISTDPTSLKCAACGCHRNFHRRESEEPNPIPTTTTHVIEYQPLHRHHPPAPPRSPSSASPPPISSSYYPSAPHMLLALSGGLTAGPPPENAGIGIHHHHHSILTPSPNSRKRFRTKFTQNQKEKMYEFAERVGWKMQRKDDEIVQEFCNDAGVERGVLKVWMHNNKNTLGKKENGKNTTETEHTQNGHDNINSHEIDEDDDDDKMNGGINGAGDHAGTNGSSSSS